MNEELRKRPHGPVCALDVLRTFPDFHFPSWEEYRPQDKRELLRRFDLSWSVQDADYATVFSSDLLPQPGTRAGTSTIPLQSGNDTEYFVAKNGRLIVWRNPMLADRGDAMLIHLYRNSPEDCETVARRMFDGKLRIPRPAPWEFLESVPFMLGNTSYELSSHSTPAQDVNGAVTEDFTISVVRPNTSHEPIVHTPLCRGRVKR